MLTYFEDLMAKGSCRVEDRISVFHTPVTKGQLRLAFGNELPVQIDGTLVGYGH